MNLQDYEIIQLQDLLARLKPQSASYRDLVGQSDNSTATITGQIGQYISATVLTAAKIALTTNTAANIANISLTPGDWDTWGDVFYEGNAATTVNYIYASISNTSATLDTTPGRFSADVPSGAAIFGSSSIITVGCQCRISLSATTTIYLVAQSGFAVNANNGYGIIQARRRRHFPG